MAITHLPICGARIHRSAPAIPTDHGSTVQRDRFPLAGRTHPTAGHADLRGEPQGVRTLPGERTA
jgi:hypothetical protein